MRKILGFTLILAAIAGFYSYNEVQKLRTLLDEAESKKVFRTLARGTISDKEVFSLTATMGIPMEPEILLAIANGLGLNLRQFSATLAIPTEGLGSELVEATDFHIPAVIFITHGGQLFPDGEVSLLFLATQKYSLLLTVSIDSGDGKISWRIGEYPPRGTAQGNMVIPVFAYETDPDMISFVETVRSDSAYIEVLKWKLNPSSAPNFKPRNQGYLMEVSIGDRSIRVPQGPGLPELQGLPVPLMLELHPSLEESRVGRDKSESDATPPAESTNAEVSESERPAEVPPNKETDSKNHLKEDSYEIQFDLSRGPDSNDLDVIRKGAGVYLEWESPDLLDSSGRKLGVLV